MLKKAVSTYAINSGSQSRPQQPVQTNQISRANGFSAFKPLHPNGSAGNIPVAKTSLKRKFDRTMSTTSTGSSSLSQLHPEAAWFDENDFEDDEAIDLDYTVNPTKKKKPTPERISQDIKYPTIDTITYPTLPPATPIQRSPPSSAPVPWSTSPADHFLPPEQRTLPPLSPERLPPRRSKLPWEKEVKKAPEENSKYPWNKSASAVKKDQKEMRRQNAARTGVGKLLDKPATSVPATMLSDEQLAVAKAVVDDGKSVFFTGSAGTGKSVLMRSIISQLRMKFIREPDRLAITASTGLAACVIEGTTLHSWAGIGLGKEPVPELCKKIKRNAKTKTKWLRTKVLIIDEISMVDGELFDKLEQIARSIRNNGRPFGGIQVVVTGDFFQLPPVPDRNTAAKFAFDAATWNTCIQHTILLTHVFRQKDPAFANMLNEMRLGKLSQTSIQNFKKLSRPLEFKDEVSATELFPTRYEVDNANSARMKNLSGQEMVFAALDSGVNDENVRKKILANFMAPETLTLKKGAQVMLIKNIDTQLVNGTLGRVTSFMDEACYAAYKDDEETYRIAQEGSDSEEKAEAQKRFDAARYKHKDGAPTKYWPMVRFPLVDGTYRDMLCMPEEWKTENQQNEITAKRVQVPLILAWALSIHKAQGQTLNRVKVDLGKVFEKGQAYVALSRATSQAGLQVLNFNPSKVMVHAKVTTFYQKLVHIDTVVASNKEKKAGASAAVYEKKFADIDDDDELYMYG